MHIDGKYESNIKSDEELAGCLQLRVPSLYGCYLHHCLCVFLHLLQRVQTLYDAILPFFLQLIIRDTVLKLCCSLHFQQVSDSDMRILLFQSDLVVFLVAFSFDFG